MGHRRLGGFVSEVTLFGTAYMRIDVPREDGSSVTQYYGAGSIYCLTPTTEDVARLVAKREVPSPVGRWELPAVVVDQDDDNEEEVWN